MALLYHQKNFCIVKLWFSNNSNLNGNSNIKVNNNIKEIMNYEGIFKKTYVNHI